MWRHPWPVDIISVLIFSMNREGTITNSELEIAALVLHKATLRAAVPEARLVATVSWSTKEASTITTLVADFLCLRALHLRQFFINPSVFNHPGIDNCMTDDASRLFELSDTSLLDHMSSVYP